MNEATAQAIALKLAKAESFFTMAEFAMDLQMFDAAVSLLASAAINASDVLILRRGGIPPSGQDHGQAVRVLKRAAGDASARQLERVLVLKNRAQYEVRRCSGDDADGVFKSAERLLNKSKEIE